MSPPSTTGTKRAGDLTAIYDRLRCSYRGSKGDEYEYESLGLHGVDYVAVPSTQAL